MKHTLKNPNFMLLMATQTVEQIGDSLTLMSLIAWVMSMPGGTTTANMTILLFWIGLPIILIGPFSGVFIDRFSRKALLLSATFVKGSFIFLIFLYIKEPGLVPLLYFFVFMKSFATQFFIPAKSSFVPDIVKDRESLMEANSISTTAMVITQITTYAAAGLLIAEFGPQKILLASFLLYPLAMAMIAMIRAKEEH
ncbi:MAG TPA: MFS transporter, partial [Candidatus Goldiibacteriota bacterium]|nr:MFS transporter [Candidatus Goldiibacteriota bacterium]